MLGGSALNKGAPMACTMVYWGDGIDRFQTFSARSALSCDARFCEVFIVDFGHGVVPRQLPLAQGWWHEGREKPTSDLRRKS
jgi:hypothetical protein